jgi:hypothetical protein
MSEGSINDQVKTELKAMEKARAILIGGAGKWYRFPLVLIWPLLLALFVLDRVNVEISSEMQLILILSVFIWDLGSAVAVMNKRIDMVVELTGAEAKLEEKHRSIIKTIAK